MSHLPQAPAEPGGLGDDSDFWSSLLSLPQQSWSTISSSISSAAQWSWSIMLSPFNMADAPGSPSQDTHLQLPPVNLNGPLRRLKTLAEVQASEATIDVFIAEIHPKATKVACDAMRPLLPDDHKKINLAHLRRPCSYAQLPEHLQSKLCPTSFFEAIASKTRRKKGANKASFILLCATCLVDEQHLLNAITEAFREPEYIAPLRLHSIAVPLFPPTSNEQAEKWSTIYWPTSFKNNNPYGPHPATIARAEWELTESKLLNADTCMKLARAVAADSKDCAIGEPIGVVLVERIAGAPARVVAVASDARYRGQTAFESDRSTCGRGNVTAHAVLRAIGMVAQKRRIIDKKSDALLTTDPTAPSPPVSLPETIDVLASDSPIARPSGEPTSCLALLPPNPASTDIFLDVPITDRERLYFDPPTLAPRGYLCLNLELYVTHEPCIMCSMAILHSRFGRVVFEKEMRTTGALMAQRQEIISPTKTAESQVPMHRALPPTKSAKRRNSRKNSKLRAIQAAIEEEEARSPPLEYGLWWRAQLNWKFLCWQWRQERMNAGPTAMLKTTSSSSSDADTSKTSGSRRPSIGGPSSTTSAIGIEDLADLVKSMTLSTIPDRVHI